VTSAAAATGTIGVVGARGYVGAELLRLLAAHRRLRTAFVSSRALAGERVRTHVAEFAGDLAFEDLDAGAAANRRADVVILALPNGLAPEYVAAIDAAGGGTVIVDVSTDHRFNDAWAYGLPEHFRSAIRGARRISNPGCYATAIQVAIRPALGVLAGPPHCFGVSGYSGAGTTPSEKNDPERLRDNLLPYSLTGHVHEREASRHLGTQVFFTPHVAPFFRGITVTVSMPLTERITAEGLRGMYVAAYAHEPLVRVQEAPPLVRDIAGRHEVAVGGFAVDESTRRAVVVATIDNLLKGAATQAVQNVNLACGFDELEGIREG
jgi:N-acetyl-gamma-glutamyl-phosphate reductase